VAAIVGVVLDERAGAATSAATSAWALAAAAPLAVASEGVGAEVSPATSVVGDAPMVGGVDVMTSADAAGRTGESDCEGAAEHPAAASSAVATARTARHRRPPCLRFAFTRSLCRFGRC
jgi:hypothetical protein